MTAHSAIGASSMYRWSACPGSVRLSKDIPSYSSAYAEDGTDAHTVAAYCLLNNAAPLKMVGTRVEDVVITREMAETIGVYIEAVQAISDEPAVLHVEQSFDLSAIHPGCFGTADAVVWDPRAKLLTVIDYKHGAGIPVNVYGNPQLRYYALGALLSLGYPAENVRLVIVQPRCDHPDGPVRAEEIAALDLLDFATDLKKYAVATEDPNAPLVPGEWCRFCPAGKANACPAVKNNAQTLAKMVFQPATSYDPQDLKRALDGREAMKAWLKNLDEFAYAEAEAGRPIPGYKLVEKQGRRKWRDESEVEIWASAEGDSSWFEPRKVKSPAQLEKVAGKVFVAQHAITESSGHVLVPDTDKRPAVRRLSAQDAFTPIAANPGETEWP